jgi:holliday junction DNA helicase RuvA
MIGYLRGKIKIKARGYVILDVRDVGYKVHVNDLISGGLSVGQETEFYIYHHVKEDISALYGFMQSNHLEMFELLISVSGIGPKSAMGILAVADIEQIKDSVVKGDSSLLTKVSGIGKKTGERIVLELRGKVEAVASDIGAKAGAVSASGEEIDALMALGYSLIQARDALKEIDPSIKDSGERIRAALKGMGR